MNITKLLNLRARHESVADARRRKKKASRLAKTLTRTRGYRVTENDVWREALDDYQPLED